MMKFPVLMELYLVVHILIYSKLLFITTNTKTILHRIILDVSKPSNYQ